MIERKILRRVAAILYHRRAGFAANGMGVWRVPGGPRSSRRGARMAAVRGVSHCYERPTYADWPYSVFTMAHGRSKEECDAILDSIADEHDLHGDDRAVLYSSTEFKKIRLRYFTGRLRGVGGRARGGRGWASGPVSPRTGGRELDRPPTPLDTRASEVIYARAVGLLPGGVNSPVRAMRSIGRDHPIFIERGEGFELIDADGHRYVDWVCSWGPLILGHAHPDVVEAVQEAAAKGTSFGAPTEAEVELAAEVRDRVRVGGDGAAGQLGHGGLDERDPPRPRRDRARQGWSSSPAPTTATSTGSSPRPARASRPRASRPARGCRRARREDTIVVPWNYREPLAAAVAEHEVAAILCEPIAANMGVVPPARRLPGLPARAGRRERRAAGLRRGHHRLPRRPRRGPGALRRLAPT